MARVNDEIVTCKRCGNEFSYVRFRKSGKVRLYCDSCIVGGDGDGKRKFTFSLSAQDWKLLGEIQQTLGCDVSETVRTSIRVYNALLKK